MKSVLHFFEKGTIAAGALAATALVGFLALTGMVLLTPDKPSVDMRIEPHSKTLTLGDSFTASVIVESPTDPVNAFGGVLHFNDAVLEVSSIDYNTSIANLWAEKPWYEAGDGTIHFAGGTTLEGGFTGTGSLLTVTFKTKAEGVSTLDIVDARILKHDGLGTDAALAPSLESIFIIEDTPDRDNKITRDDTASTYTVLSEKHTTDLNGDGIQSIADVSIFMFGFASGNEQFDLNDDGKINTKDLSILMHAK